MSLNFSKTPDPQDQLVRLVAGERNIHRLMTQVAAEVDLIRECRKIFNENILKKSFDPSLSHLCILYRIQPELFMARIRLIVHTLNLVQHEQDHYEVLEVNPQASRDEIKRAFRRLSLIWHPDKNPNNPGAAEHFRSLYQAYEVLSDDALREHYDRQMFKPFWNEESLQEDPTLDAQRRYRRHLLQMGMVVAALLVLCFFIDLPSPPVFRYNSTLADHPLKEEGTVKSSLEGKIEDHSGEKTRKPSVLPVTEGSEDFSSVDEVEKGFISSEHMDNVTQAKSVENKIEILSSAEHSETVRKEPILKVEQPMEPTLPKTGVVSHHDSPEPKSPAEPSRPVPTPEKNTTDKLKKPKPSKTAVHTVQEGDTLYEIALANRMSVEALCRINGIEKETILQIGRQLKLASDEMTSASHRDSSLQTTKKKISLNDSSPKLSVDRTEEYRIRSFRELPLEESRRSENSESRSRSLEKTVETSSEIVSDHTNGSPSAKEVQKQIRNFLKLYTGTYEKKDLSAFLDLFEPGARENGNLLTDLIPTYRKSFKRAQSLRYRIELKNWVLSRQELSLNGTFHLRVHFSGESPLESFGSIRFTLTPHGDDFRVRRLDYRFADSKKTQ